VYLLHSVRRNDNDIIARAPHHTNEVRASSGMAWHGFLFYMWETYPMGNLHITFHSTSLCEADGRTSANRLQRRYIESPHLRLATPGTADVRPPTPSSACPIFSKPHLQALPTTVGARTTSCSAASTAGREGRLLRLEIDSPPYTCRYV